MKDGLIQYFITFTVEWNTRARFIFLTDYMFTGFKLFALLVNDTDDQVSSRQNDQQQDDNMKDYYYYCCCCCCGGGGGGDIESIF